MKIYGNGLRCRSKWSENPSTWSPQPFPIDCKPSQIPNASGKSSNPHFPKNRRIRTSRNPPGSAAICGAPLDCVQSRGVQQSQFWGNGVCENPRMTIFFTLGGSGTVSNSGESRKWSKIYKIHSLEDPGRIGQKYKKLQNRGSGRIPENYQKIIPPEGLRAGKLSKNYVGDLILY